MVLAFPKFNQGWLAFLALVPLLFIVSRSSFKGAFFYGLVSGLIFFGGLLYWLLEITPWAGVPLTIFAWLLLSLAEALTVAFFALGAKSTLKNYSIWGRSIFIPAWWVALEFLRSVGPWGFSWGILGASQTSNLVVLQSARAIGVFGISYLILLVNQVLAESLLSLQKSGKVSSKPLTIVGAVTVAIFFLVIGGGAYSLKAKNLSLQPLKVGLIQGNIPQEEKWAVSKKEKIEAIYWRQTFKMMKYRPYLVIWPESAVPGFLFREREYLQKVRFLAQKLKSYLLVGTLHLDDRDQQYNSVFLFSPQGKVVGRYDKIRLVLFGEYVPPWPIFSYIKAIAGLGENITPGKRAFPFDTSKGKFGTVICFESADPFLARKMTARGGEMLVVVTNDAWFGKTSAAAQHLEMLRVRAVENGVYALQVANTGISAIIDPRGQILKKTSLFERKILLGKVVFLKRKTFYTRFGHLFPYFTLFIGAGHYLALPFRRKLPLRGGGEFLS